MLSLEILKVLTLRVERDGAVLELVERGIVVLIDSEELLLQSLKFVFILRIRADQLL